MLLRPITESSRVAASTRGESGGTLKMKIGGASRVLPANFTFRAEIFFRQPAQENANEEGEGKKWENRISQMLASRPEK